MTPHNVRFVWYYGICQSCGANSVRSPVPRGDVLPCDKCEIGFRLVLGRRALWDDEDGQRRDSFQSAVVKITPGASVSLPALEAVAQDDNSTDSPDLFTGKAKSELTESELRWLFGYGERGGGRAM